MIASRQLGPTGTSPVGRNQSTNQRACNDFRVNERQFNSILANVFRNDWKSLDVQNHRANQHAALIFDSYSRTTCEPSYRASASSRAISKWEFSLFGIGPKAIVAKPFIAEVAPSTSLVSPALQSQSHLIPMIPVCALAWLLLGGADAAGKKNEPAGLLMSPNTIVGICSAACRRPREAKRRGFEVCRV
jgi:hypothetical protein